MHRIDDVGPSRTPFGVVLFDTPYKPSGGWASKAGGDAFRVNGRQDLPSDHLWVTNLGVQDFPSYRSIGGNLRRSNFFRTDLSAIADELGLPRDNPFDSVPLLSEIADRASSIAYNEYEFSRIGLSLRDTIAPAVTENLVTPSTYGSRVADLALINAHKTHHVCAMRGTLGARAVRFRWSRSQHADTLMRMPIPDGAWSQYTGEPPPSAKRDSGGGDSALYAWLDEVGTEQPALIRLSFEAFDATADSLLQPSGEEAVREWVPVHEAMLMVQHGRVSIRGVLVGQGYTSIMPFAGVRPPANGLAGSVSLSNGIVAENYWMVLASLRSDSTAGTRHRIPAPMSIWMRAWDRLICFRAAQAFQRAGIPVQSYGGGAVNVSLTPRKYQEALDVCMQQGMTPPMWLIRDSSISKRKLNRPVGAPA
ncbi:MULTISPECIES: hypothetical protein [unclassified Thioalkalivibrio]|uniref:hypothetical protein n=1 Tax=unclassified Thioalkalivibrio TaxID=2621013 RepID=UPI000374A190|nr:MULTISPECIES: hypothetical protein [unclassified Thioalkalivibrio]